LCNEPTKNPLDSDRPSHGRQQCLVPVPIPITIALGMQLQETVYFRAESGALQISSFFVGANPILVLSIS
jgi:hypothetical protein